jgi:ABC-type multidrug transport system ATPase subunit
MSILRVHELTKRFGDFTAVDRVSFEIERGRIFGLLGPNGSGKSTIIRMLCGLLRPSEGEAEVDGIDVAADPDAVKARIGYMSQRFSLYRDLTVLENMTFYGRVYGLRGAKARARREALIELVGVGGYLHRLAGNLSGGWQQRLALACCLLHEPRVVFLDEPTAGIDPVARRQLWDLLFDLSGHGTTFLVTTHYMDEAERCSSVGYLYLSKLITCGDPTALRTLPIARPEGTRWLKMECAHSTQAYVLLRDLPGVRQATIFGTSLRLLVDAAADPSQFVEPLKRAGIDVSSVLEVEPSLEDVFVALTQQAVNAR